MSGQRCGCFTEHVPQITFNPFPLFMKNSATLRQQFTYQCVLSEGDYHLKLDLLQV